MSGDSTSDNLSGDLVADVLVPVAVDTAYSYRVPKHLALEPGDFVTVPLGTREATGVVWATRRSASGSNLKVITEKRDLPPVRDPLRKLIDFIARWTLAHNCVEADFETLINSLNSRWRRSFTWNDILWVRKKNINFVEFVPPPKDEEVIVA